MIMGSLSSQRKKRVRWDDSSFCAQQAAKKRGKVRRAQMNVSGLLTPWLLGIVPVRAVYADAFSPTLMLDTDCSLSITSSVNLGRL